MNFSGVLHSDISDVSPFVYSNRSIKDASTSDTINVTIDGFSAQSLGFISEPGFPGNSSWEDGGTWSVTLRVVIGNTFVRARCSAIRIDSSGNILQVGTPTSLQVLTSGNKDYTISNPSWNDGEEDSGNRIAILINIENTSPISKSVTLGTNTTTEKVETNISTILTEDGYINNFICGHEFAPIAPDSRLYYTDYVEDKIISTNMNGLDIQEIISIGLDAPRGIFVDSKNDYIYWVDHSHGTINRSTVEGNDAEVIYSGLPSPIDIFMDNTTNLLYVVDTSLASIIRLDREGQHLTTIVDSSDGVENPKVVEILSASGLMYWTETTIDGKIKRADIDGSNIQVIISGLQNPFDMAIDNIADKLYLSNYEGELIFEGVIQNSDLDGLNISDVASGLKVPLRMALNKKTNYIYVYDNFEKAIFKIDVQNGDKENIIEVSGSAGGMDIYHPSVGVKLFIGGPPREYNSSELYICGYDQISELIDMFTIGRKDNASETTFYICGSVDSQASGNLFVHGYVDSQASSDLFTYGYTDSQASVNLFMHGHNATANFVDLLIGGSGGTGISGDLFVDGFDNIIASKNLFINGSMGFEYDNLPLIINGLRSRPEVSCPIIDPTASIQISSDLIDIYQSRIDALINQLGKNVYLEFTPIREPCPNCEYDTMRKRSTGVYKAGGPKSFARGLKCPYCKGRGFTETPVNKCIKCLIKWNPEDAKNYGISVSKMGGIVRLKTYLTEANDLSRAQTVIVNHDIVNQMKLKVKLVQGPIPVGLREDRYCITFWELI